LKVHEDIEKLQTPFYVFYADEFINNYSELEGTFKRYYPNYRVAYSVKTNYTPSVLRIVLERGGYAEVVSDMEYTLAERIGFPSKKIIYNGPGKGEKFELCMLSGGKLHLDNWSEVERAIDVARRNRSSSFRVAVRVNFDIDNGIQSRFGLDLESGDYKRAVDKLNAEENICVNGIHFHISRARSLAAWSKRIRKALEIASSAFDYPVEYIDLGSGMYGHFDDDLQAQFGATPDYDDYAQTVLLTMADFYSEKKYKPVLFTEPGTTLVSKYFHLFTSVLDIKQIRGRNIGLLDCSFQNVGEICKLKRPPIRNLSAATTEGIDVREHFDSINLVGYTCLEQDVICPEYKGKIAQGDRLEILNVGGYSIVEKPPFIHPDIPIYMLKNRTLTCIKRAQTFDDIFAPYMIV